MKTLAHPPALQAKRRVLLQACASAPWLRLSLAVQDATGMGAATRSGFVARAFSYMPAPTPCI